MRSGVVFPVLFALLNIPAVGRLPAQSLTPCIRAVRFSMERDLFLAARANARPAYTATIKQTFEQTLPDGNSIRWSVESVQARDEAGRMMRQHIEGCDPDSGGESQLRIRISIFDPAAKTDTSWNTGPGSMGLTTVFHQPQPITPPSLNDIPRTPSSPYRPQVTREDLGTRTIAGMEATGIRTTETIPAGAEGNDMPLKMVHEIWTSRENRTTLLVIDDNPYTGHHTWEVESLTVGPPDPALFTPPANYKVWDENPRAQAAAEIKP